MEISRRQVLETILGVGGSIFVGSCSLIQKKSIAQPELDGKKNKLASQYTEADMLANELLSEVNKIKDQELRGQDGNRFLYVITDPFMYQYDLEGKTSIGPVKKYVEIELPDLHVKVGTVRYYSDNTTHLGFTNGQISGVDGKPNNGTNIKDYAIALKITLDFIKSH